MCGVILVRINLRAIALSLGANCGGVAELTVHPWVGPPAG